MTAYPNITSSAVYLTLDGMLDGLCTGLYCVIRDQNSLMGQLTQGIIKTLALFFFLICVTLAMNTHKYQ